jgi:hypothetical protein
LNDRSKLVRVEEVVEVTHLGGGSVRRGRRRRRRRR